jgi:hypothetical protein
MQNQSGKVELNFKLNEDKYKYWITINNNETITKWYKILLIDKGDKK